MVPATSCVVSVLLLSSIVFADSDDDDMPRGLRNPTDCEVCKYLAVELQGRLDETGKVRGVIETGHGLDTKFKKKKEYKKSELRLIEVVHEPHVCDRILEYNVHAEREKSLRYAKGQSETMSTLHNLVNKGVKVELGIPYELWDQPSVEITNMQRMCFKLVENYEDDIEEWYYGPQDQPLIEYLCRDRILHHTNTECLSEKFDPNKKSDDEKDSSNGTHEKPEEKGDTGMPASGLPPHASTEQDMPPPPSPSVESNGKEEL
ncbi:hypothetical protein C0Q70_00355 [Pomacea canaliculata]|uniref:DUF3456 domain-containing protein n=1 Tax=Pomacea canaliculata TaxID=400727 RepID=A0A2T7PWE9_POMCA|nr:protein canopy 4-like [Pomacea canaliculata]PVD37754.1 hypothetical protein C0Q70_00355 [Pomacea canaliculata]